MPIFDWKEREMKEAMQAEIRTCSVCHMEVPNPFIEKCPRCMNPLPHMNLNCDGCLHRQFCPSVPPKKG